MMNCAEFKHYGLIQKLEHITSILGNVYTSYSKIFFLHMQRFLCMLDCWLLRLHQPNWVIYRCTACT